MRFRSFFQCKAVDPRSRGLFEGRCTKQAGHDGPHVRETIRGRLVYWPTARQPSAKGRRE